MKKKNLLILFLISMFIFVGKVGATNVKLECPKSANTNDTFTCTVTTDQIVNISSELRVYQGSTTMSASDKPQSIIFKATKAGEYDISVMSEDYNTTYKTNTINVSDKTTTKQTTTTKAKSTNNYLSSISINGDDIKEFNKTSTKYLVNVEYDITKISIDAKAEDDTASINIDGPKSLEVGDNTYTIGVKSEDETTKFYKVIVTREEKGKSSNTKLKSIKVKGYHFNFDKNSQTFYLNIKKEDTELDMTVKTKDKNASYKIEGNDELKDGSEIKIIVTAENGDKDTYRIIIQKKESNYIPFIVGAILFILLVVVIVILIIKNKNKDVDDNNQTKSKKKPSKSRNDKESGINPEEEKTKEMPSIDANQIEEHVPIDNDEEEETRILSYEEQKELEKTSFLDFDNDLDKAIDDELEKTLTLDDFKKNMMMMKTK